MFEGKSGPQKCEKWKKPLKLRKNSKASKFYGERNDLFFVDLLQFLAPSWTRGREGVGVCTRGVYRAKKL